jgi:uncharacterized cupredoxin-like copper-binding protein
MRTKTSKLPSAKPQIALLAMALVISSGAVYAQMHHGQVSVGNPVQSIQTTQTTQGTQSVTTATNSSFTQPAKSSNKIFTIGHSTTRPQIAGGENENEDD